MRKFLISYAILTTGEILTEVVNGEKMLVTWIMAYSAENLLISVVRIS